MIDFQTLIQTLQNFWAEQGCAVLISHDQEVGAGTFHPATFLRAIGPEPWRSVYVQPCRRPKDGRYGANPNRLQHYFQLQVVIKPSPDNLQELYLESLARLGLKVAAHDIRFVEDNWESPTLGAWGLGWEVWLNGMEVTQFTYFQEVGSLACQPVLGEITYGLERIAMFLQEVDSVYHLRWNDLYTYDDLFHQNERENSVYNFEQANIEQLLQRFDALEAETQRLIEQDLPIPAYECMTQSSHLFNLLDARDAISVTERARFIARVRNMSRLIARAYLDSRQKQGFPLLSPSSLPSENKLNKPL